MAPCARLAGLCNLELLCSVIDTIKTSRRQYLIFWRLEMARKWPRAQQHLMESQGSYYLAPFPASPIWVGSFGAARCAIDGHNTRDVLYSFTVAAPPKLPSARLAGSPPRPGYVTPPVS